MEVILARFTVCLINFLIGYNDGGIFAYVLVGIYNDVLLTLKTMAEPFVQSIRFLDGNDVGLKNLNNFCYINFKKNVQFRFLHRNHQLNQTLTQWLNSEHL